ncbi:putative pentatricopeptide repeat-containing protein At3g25060, mitochondrial [Durio zibethinus]|uniref:Pentatricopeptide repeat-containing protein At3g25060, mitochondrial n=1 Tax=Durio zibethinus TaxID=66656 RepID=A0A6P6A123_DURZI|nr:putative pentatricopeptide repeat-containing protein At3g25060, mitochondrial [Durio zibethinus]
MQALKWQKHLKPLLLACKDKKSVAKIHAFVILTGVYIHKTSVGNLIASYVRVGDILSARKVFDKLSTRGVDAWNAMIVAYSRNSFPKQVLGFYHQMILEGIRPDSSTFTVAIKACVSLMDLEMGEEIWRKAVDFGYQNDVFVASSVLNLYVKCGKMDDAMMVFNKMPRRDLVCWTTLVTGFAQSGWASEAIDLYRKMQMEGVEGDSVVMLGLIQASVNLGDSKLGLTIHGYMIRKGLSMDVVVQTSLLDMYAKNGYLEYASRVLKKMPSMNNISWGALISGFAQNGFARNALELLVEMQGYGFKPDLVSLVGGLLACSQGGLLKLGKSIHGYITRRLDLDQVSGTAVIDMYAKCGVLSYARALFDRIDSRDRISWNAMIAGYGVHGHGKEALSLFLQMTNMSIKPDHATFAALLSALGHSGLVEEGQYWFNLMVNVYNIQPTEKHYACMVDLLARAGLVEEAYKLIDSMDNEPGAAVWVALLSGCCNHGKSSIGEMAAKKVLELNPDDLGIHALVSNFFAMGNMWDEVAAVRKLMKETGLKKVPGYSVLDVNGQLHAFLMADKSHNKYEAIASALDKLDHEMRLHDQNEGLPVAFGL